MNGWFTARDENFDNDIDNDNENSGVSTSTKIIAAACLLLISVCHSEATELYFFQRGYVEGGTGAATALTDAAVTAFAAKNPKINVKVVGVPWGEAGDLKLRTALLARRRIDIFRLAHDQLPGFMPRQGQLLSPIDDQLTPEDRTDFGPTLDAVTVNGKAQAWPLWSTAISMIANVEILQAAGVAIPPEGTAWTWDEWVAALRAVKAHAGSSGAGMYGFNAPSLPPLFEWAPLLMTHCGALFWKAPSGPKMGEPFLAPGLAGAMEKVRALVSEGLAAPGFGVDDDTAAQQSFLSGRVAFLFSSPGFLRKLEGSAIEFRVMPIPVGDLRPITTGAVGCFAVVDSGEADRVAAAHAFARYLTSAEIAAEVPGWYLAPPARGSVSSFFDQPLYAPLRPILPSATYMVPPHGSGFYDRIVVPRITGAVIAPEGRGDAAAAIAEIEAAARRLSLD